MISTKISTLPMLQMQKHFVNTSSQAMVGMVGGKTRAIDGLEIGLEQNPGRTCLLAMLASGRDCIALQSTDGARLRDDEDNVEHPGTLATCSLPKW